MSSTPHTHSQRRAVISYEFRASRRSPGCHSPVTQQVTAPLGVPREDYDARRRAFYAAFPAEGGWAVFITARLTRAPL